MAFVLADRVKETTTTTGTGTLTLAGAATNYRSFAAIGNGNSTYYAIIDNTNNVWEVGIGTYTSSGTTLSRTTIFSNSSGTTAALTLAAGTKDVICTQAAWSTISDTNLGLGYQSFAALSSGTSNTAFGYQTLNAITTNTGNTAVGYQAAKATTNSGSTAVGYQAGTKATGIATTFGYQAGDQTVGSTGFTGLGYWAGHGNVSGNYQTHIGMYAGGSVNANQGDTVNIGYGSGYNGGGTGTVAIGSNAMQSGNSNNSVAVGYYAMYNGAGSQNVAVGYNALYGAAGSTAAACTAIGYNALTAVTTSGGFNTAVGYSAGQSVVSNSSNVFVGSQCGQLCTGGSNTLIGASIGATSLTAYNNNTVVGQSAMYQYAGTGNVVVGFNALSAFTGTGNYNLVIGYNGASALTSGNNNVLIGGDSGSAGFFIPNGSSNNIVISDNPNTGATVRMYIGGSGTGGFNASMAQKSVASATAATGTINFDTGTQQTLYYTTNASANFTINVRSSSTVTFNNAIPVGQSLTIEFLNTNGASAFYMNAFTIDGTSVTPKWITGTAPSAGNANAIDKYTIEIIKTAASTYTVLAKQEKFA